MKTIVIFGGSGFIGQHLVEELKDDYKLIVLSRNDSNSTAHKNTTVKYYSQNDPNSLVSIFDEAEGIINLAGQNIGDKSWSAKFKHQILQSRIETGKLIKEVFEICKNKPSFFIQSSATHFYGVDPSDDEITEDDQGKQNSFLSMVAVQAEENVGSLEKQARVVYARTGIVLDGLSGALPKMAMPVKFFVGGPLGYGKQWVPWIHIYDEVRAIRFIIENELLEGGINLTAPNPVCQKNFAKAIGKALNRPAILPAPAFALRLILGKERANDLLLSGLKVVPGKLIKAGFKFQFETVSEALKNIYSQI